MAISRELRNLLKNPKRCRLTNLYKFLTNSEKNIINAIIDEVIERNPIRKYDYKDSKVVTEEAIAAGVKEEQEDYKEETLKGVEIDKKNQVILKDKIISE
jgi:hypothetical protein